MNVFQFFIICKRTNNRIIAWFGDPRYLSRTSPHFSSLHSMCTKFSDLKFWVQKNIFATETPQTRSIALSAAHSLYMGTYTPKHSLVWMHRGFRFLPCPLPQGCFNRIPSFSRKEDCFGAQIHQNSACQQLRKSIISSQNFKRIMEINAIFFWFFQNIFDSLWGLYIFARFLEIFWSVMMMIAFITIKSSLVPLIEGICAENLC